MKDPPGVTLDAIQTPDPIRPPEPSRHRPGLSLDWATRRRLDYRVTAWWRLMSRRELGED